MSVYYADVQPMVARRHGQGGGALPSPGKCTRLIHFNYNTMVLAQKEHKSLRQKTFHQLKCDWGRGSAPNPTGWEAYSAPPDPLAVFKGSASQQRKKAKWTGRKGRRGERRGGKVWRDGEKMERKEEVDFARIPAGTHGSANN